MQLQKKCLSLLGLVLMLQLLAAAPITWSVKEGKWNGTVRMTRTQQEDYFLFKSEKNDPCCMLQVPKADFRKFTALEITYRIPEKLKAGNKGMLYYRLPGDKGYPGYAVNLGSWIDDGQWHTKKVWLNAKTVSSFAAKWQKAEVIEGFRFDPFEGVGTMELRSITFTDGTPPAEVPAAAVKVPAEEFLEKTAEDRFVAFKGNYSVSREDPASGSVCMEQGNSSTAEQVAESVAVLPVKPKTRYMLKVRNRNTVPVGQILFSCVQSRSAERREGTSYVDRCWTQVPCNMDRWTECEMELETFPNTHGLVICFHVSNRGLGKVWWDQLELVEVKEMKPAVSVKSYPLMASFTDQKTCIGYQYPETDAKGKTRNRIAWKTLDPKTTPLILEMNPLVPQDAGVSVALVRGKKECFKASKKATEPQEYILPLETLAAGKYLLVLTVEKGGKELCRSVRVLYRQQALPQETFEDIRTSSALPGRIAGINGKPVFSVYYSHVPYMHCTPDFLAFPKLDEHISNMKQQLGLNTLNVITMKDIPNRARLPREEYLKQAEELYAKSYLAMLDYCRKNNLLGLASLHMGTALAPRGRIDYELTARVIKRIKHHPALYQYSYDEPEPRKVTAEEIKKLYETVKQADPDHLVCINLCNKGSFAQYAPWSDIASYDYYPFPHSELNYWRLYTQTISELRPTSPLRTYLQLFQFQHTRLPNDREAYASLIASLIDGARCLSVYAWFSHNLQSLTSSVDLQATARVISEHSKKLCDFIFSAKEMPLSCKASKEIIFRYYENGNTGCLLVVNTSKNKPIMLELPAWNGTICDFFDSAWNFHPGEKVTLAPYETLTLRVEKR